MGVLVVTGNVTMAPDANWAGMIIAGGRLITPLGLFGNFYIRGYIITGLSCATGGPCVVNTIGQNWSIPALGLYKLVKWNWCYANLAIQSLSAMVPVKNTFIDNWAAY